MHHHDIAGAEMAVLPKIPGTEDFFICPQPQRWSRIYIELENAWKERGDRSIPPPPPPLILGGWIWSEDWDKHAAWQAQAKWAAQFGFSDRFPQPSAIPSSERHTRRFEVITPPPPPDPPAPFYEPRDGRKRGERAKRPSPSEASDLLSNLRAAWPEIAGRPLADHCQPLAFTGRRLRRLLTAADPDFVPPWGDEWNVLYLGARRWEFSKLRVEVNRALDPHGVDHIDFLTSEWSQSGF